ncbi:hypothetical protein G3T14_16980 [Methylobacterium sp. BTF04]|uniref:hypothetical protein n=1 Tax=Methylobacterium sp. BTF04 TaxID=2708300 RepID=UPI0013D368CB|nr:hypothetical protein [Methylobacterium sp. BTF04]NEU13809.1 hypothetical protein [Methylobacterium sp. BTF04]
MIKSMLVALTLAAAGTGSAFAETRTINVWGARLEVPAAQAEPTPLAAMAARPDARFMAMPAGHTRTPRHAR